MREARPLEEERIRIVSREEARKDKPEEKAALARARRFLSQASMLDQRIEHKLVRQARLKDLVSRRTGVSLVGEDGTLLDSRSLAVQRVIDLEREIDGDIDHLHDVTEEICRVLYQISNQDIALILDDIFLGNCSMEKAAERSGFSVSYTRKLVRWGLLEVDRLLEGVIPFPDPA